MGDAQKGQDERRRQAFEETALPHLGALYNMALKMTRDPSVAEDLVQDTYIRAYRFFSRYQEGTNCKAWLYKILRNAHINRYRKLWKNPEPIAFETIEEHSELALTQSSAVGIRGTEEIVADGRLAEDVRAALDRLPKEFRMVVVLSIVEGYSYKEIASIMSCPIGTVMSRLFRARKLLQEALAGHARERGLLGAVADSGLNAGDRPGAAGAQSFAGRA